MYSSRTSSKGRKELTKHVEDDERVYKDSDFSDDQIKSRFERTYGSLPTGEVNAESYLQIIQACITNLKSAFEKPAEPEEQTELI